jgi:hypothetical protein
MTQEKLSRIQLFEEWADGRTTLNAVRDVFNSANKYLELSPEEIERLINETLTRYDICPCDECGQACVASRDALMRAIFEMARQESSHHPRFTQDLTQRLGGLQQRIQHLHRETESRIQKIRKKRQNMTPAERRQRAKELFGNYVDVPVHYDLTEFGVDVPGFQGGEADLWVPSHDPSNFDLSDLESGVVSNFSAEFQTPESPTFSQENTSKDLWIPQSREVEFDFSNSQTEGEYSGFSEFKNQEVANFETEDNCVTFDANLAEAPNFATEERVASLEDTGVKTPDFSLSSSSNSSQVPNFETEDNCVTFDANIEERVANLEGELENIQGVIEPEVLEQFKRYCKDLNTEFPLIEIDLTSISEPIFEEKNQQEHVPVLARTKQWFTKMWKKTTKEQPTQQVIDIVPERIEEEV